MIRPQPLLAPRPNIRRHPLDRHELEMIDDANYDGQGKSREQETQDSRRILAYVTVLIVACVVGWAVVMLWRLI